MNKYADKANEIRKERFKKRSCLDKVVYLTRNEALKRGYNIYKCKNCGNWHRSRSIAKLLNFIRNNK